jgi:hypothetical protein
VESVCLGEYQFPPPTSTLKLIFFHVSFLFIRPKLVQSTKYTSYISCGSEMTPIDAMTTKIVMGIVYTNRSKTTGRSTNIVYTLRMRTRRYLLGEDSRVGVEVMVTDGRDGNVRWMGTRLLCTSTMTPPKPMMTTSYSGNFMTWARHPDPGHIGRA